MRSTYNNQELAKNLLNNVQNDGLQAIAYKADTNVDGTPVLVFNPLSWERSDMVETTVRFTDAFRSRSPSMTGTPWFPRP